MKPGLSRRSVVRAAAAVAVGGAGVLPLRAEEVPDLIARAKPSIALVGSYAETDSPRFTFFGTGFAVRDGNTLVTCAHVVQLEMSATAERKLSVQVRTSTGWEQRNVTSVNKDVPRDLAILRFDGPPVPALQLAAGDTVREGQSVLTIGFPLGGALGFSPVAHRGMVAARTAMVPPANRAAGLNERAIAQLRQGRLEVYQLDMTAYPGNSGGPLLDIASGRVVGVVSSGIVKASREYALSSPSGITYAVPVGWLRTTGLLEGN